MTEKAIKLSENAVNILTFLRDNDGDISNDDISTGIGLPVKSVVGSLNSLVKKEMVSRSEGEKVEFTNEEGKVTTKVVKFMSITQTGLDALDSIGA